MTTETSIRLFCSELVLSDLVDSPNSIPPLDRPETVLHASVDASFSWTQITFRVELNSSGTSLCSPSCITFSKSESNDKFMFLFHRSNTAVFDDIPINFASKTSASKEYDDCSFDMDKSTGINPGLLRSSCLLQLSLCRLHANESLQTSQLRLYFSSNLNLKFA